MDDQVQTVEASVLAPNSVDWQDWALSIHLYLVLGGYPFPEIEAVKSNVSYPINLNSLQEDYYASIEHGTTFVKSVRNWISSDPTILWDKCPQYPPFWDLLINQWSFARDAVEGHDGEGQRGLVESMMMLIFSTSVEQHNRYKVLFKRELALPRPRTNVLPRFKSSYAKPDIAIMKQLPDSADILYRVRETGVNLSVVRCLKHCIPDDVLLGLFAVEIEGPESAANPRLLAMDLSSMQYQRRALSVKKKTIYGATVSRGIFKLYASFWDDRDELRTCKVSDACWELTSPDEFIQCLYFMRTLRQHIDASLSDDLRSFSVDGLVANIQRNPENWRDRPSKCTGDSQDKVTKRSWRGEGPGDVDGSVVEEDDLSECSVETPRMRLARIIDIVLTSNEKACRLVGWLDALPSNDHKETYGRQI